MTAGRDELTKLAQAKTGLPRSACREVLDELLTAMAEELISGGEFQHRRFGKLEVRSKQERPGRNPRNLEPATISARRVVRFVPSVRLRAKLTLSTTEIKQDVA